MRNSLSHTAAADYATAFAEVLGRAFESAAGGRVEGIDGVTVGAMREAMRGGVIVAKRRAGCGTAAATESFDTSNNGKAIADSVLGAALRGWQKRERVKKRKRAAEQATRAALDAAQQLAAAGWTSVVCALALWQRGLSGSIRAAYRSIRFSQSATARVFSEPVFSPNRSRWAPGP